MKIQEWLDSTRVIRRVGDFEFQEVRNAVVCKDWFEMSVQASSGHYCSPKDNVGPYTSVEVACPNITEEILTPYMDSAGIAGEVPIEVVDAILEKHGGIA